MYWSMEHRVSLYYRTAWWMFMKLDRGEGWSSHGPHICLGFLLDLPGVDPKRGKKESKRASKKKAFTWNSAILVVVWAKCSKGWIQGRAKIGRGRAFPLTKYSFRSNVHSNILMYCWRHMHLFESCHSGCLFFLTELFAVGYQVSDKRPLGL